MAKLTVESTVPLSSGAAIPILGFGTCQSSTCTASALAALKNGYTHIDTAQIYANESETGTAIAQSKISPANLFVCSKLWEDMYGRQPALDGVEQSLKKLGLKNIDLYLLHTPRPGRKARHRSWLGLQDAVQRGWVKTIGVSNWAPRHFDQLMVEEGVHIKPAVNQIEFHPWNQQREIREWCKENAVVVVAYSPLTQGRRLKDPTISKVAEKYERTPAQVVLRWVVQQGAVIIPKSDKEDRIVENSDIFGWELKEEDIQLINALDEGQKGNVGEWDPFAWD